MRTVILFIAFLSVGVGILAQDKNQVLDDKERLTLSVWLPDEEEALPGGVSSLLYNKLLRVATTNGLSAVPNQSRFVLTAHTEVLEKSVTPTAPAMVALNLELTFYIGDGLDGKMYESHSMQIKGVGKSENKAYISAFKNVNTNDPEVAAFIAKAKIKIVNYFNTRCDFLIQQARSLEAQEQYEEAIAALTGVPEVCRECFDKSMAAAEPIYQKHIDFNGMKKLAEAKALWAANQNMAAANAISVLIGEISPNAACYKEVDDLYAAVAKRISEVDGRDWDFKLKAQEQEGDKIAAMRDVGVAYGEGQPKEMNYNTAGWWTPQMNSGVNPR